MIHTHRWDPPAVAPTRERGVYLLHGMGEHAARYERLARRLSNDGWAVRSHDHPGHGRSTGRRGVVEPVDALVTEAATRLQAFADETGAAPFLFGHSLGGVVATDVLLTHDAPVAGLVLSAPAIAPRMTLPNRLKLAALSALAPSHPLEFPYDASVLTHDPREIAAANADELIHGYKSAALVRWLLAGADRALTRAADIDVPVLVLVAGSDHLIDIERTRRFADGLPPGALTWQLFDGYHHELLNETPERRDRVLETIVKWLDAWPGHDEPA